MRDPIQCVFRLRYPEAQQVFLVGEFNNWSTTALPMSRASGAADGSERWEAVVQLEPGRYRYCYFVIDETPSNDRASGLTFVPGGIVNEGSVLTVPHPPGWVSSN